MYVGKIKHINKEIYANTYNMDLEKLQTWPLCQTFHQININFKIVVYSGTTLNAPKFELIIGVPEEDEEKRDWENIWRDYSWKLP